MTPGSLSPLSAKARALLLAEREIVAPPEAVRRRALLRARTALWHARESATLAGAPSALATWWRRAAMAAIALLVATSAYAAWVALAPAGAPEERASQPAPLQPTARRAPANDPGPPEVIAMVEVAEPERTPRVAPHASKPAAAVQRTSPRARSVDKRAADPSAEELALLDRARRAVALGDFRAALKVIQSHARSFPKSQLGEEREALRIRALAGAGLSRKAGQAARNFESSYPKSVLTPELQKNDRTTP